VTIPSCDTEQLVEAMLLFDEELRTTDDWQDWEDHANHKYAIVHGNQRYPVKQIISLATGASVSDFSGGAESIRFLKQHDIVVEPLRLPTQTEVKIALHDLLIMQHPSSVEPANAYEELADQFDLSKALRELSMQRGGENHWQNRVRQSRRDLVDEGVIDPSDRGVWQLAQRQNRTVWVEKSITEGRHDRLSGPEALGKALCSPMRDRSGKDVYRNMRMARPGDVVLLLTDNAAISGVSVIEALTKPGFPGLPGTPWDGEVCYRTELSQYAPLDPPLDRQWILGAENRDRFLTILADHQNLFYNARGDLRQGAYFTEAPEVLVRALSEIYLEKTGKTLPLVPASQSTQAAIDERKLRGSIRLFSWIYGEEGFKSSLYLEEERNYKAQLRDRWQAITDPAALESALASADPASLANDIGDVLTGNNLLPWRYADAVKKFSEQDEARLFLAAVRDLITSDPPDVDGFNDALMPRYRTALNETGVKPASHCIPSLILWLADPNRQFFVRPEMYNRAAKALLGSTPEGQGNVMSSAYYRVAVDFARTIHGRLGELGPRDMIDVQGFLWSVFGQTRIWFGGKTYGGNIDMLPEFLERGVYAVGFGREPDVVKILDGVSKLSRQDREERLHMLEISGLKSNAKDALAGFINLVAEPAETIVIAKSTFAKGTQSVLRIAAVGRTGDALPYDPEVGHQTQMKWLCEPGVDLDLSGGFNSVASTLNSLPVAEALEMIGADELGHAIDTLLDEPDEPESSRPVPEPEPALMPPPEIQPSYAVEDFRRDTGLSAERLQGWQARLQRKRHMVFHGPPGTGKTYVAERMARLMVSDTTGHRDIVQFHPSYSYEDFIQGIRPKAVDGNVSYDNEPGRFLEFCDEAGRRSDAPCVLIIDEINRANLSRVFGELMYLLEYRDRDMPLASGERRFRIPDNVYLVGTMNTADRSIALVDHALRRRFSFVHLGPEYDVLRQRLESDGLPADSLVAALQAVNIDIDDRNYEVGISFFMNDGPDLKRHLRVIWEGEIEPYLEEYFFDQPEKVNSHRWETLVAETLAAWVDQGQD
jgi:hypothetical protein